MVGRRRYAIWSHPTSDSTHPTSPLMREILEQQLARFEELERRMVDPDVLANPARLAAIAREHGSIAKSATKYRRFKQLNTLDHGGQSHGLRPRPRVAANGRNGTG